MDILKEYGSQIGALVAAFTFIVGIWKYMSQRKENHFWKEFEVFHKLVKELVESGGQGTMYVDRQAAIMFELRYFKRYYPYSLRMLTGLKSKWAAVPDQFPRLLEELDLTIKFLETKCSKNHWTLF